jgi:hypothetical protein
MSVNNSNSTILNTRPDANRLGSNQEKPETAPAPSTSRSVPSQPENVSAQLEETRDACRELELTPGDVHTAYLELNWQITVKLDSYVEQALKAKAELEAIHRREFVSSSVAGGDARLRRYTRRTS